MEKQKFEVILLGVVFDPAKRKILIGRRENDPDIPELTWCFPGDTISNGEKIDEILKERILQQTGYEVKNLGTIFTRVMPEKKDFLLIYFLCEVFKGEEKPGKGLVELKWVAPEDVEKHFKTTFNTRLKEYILNLK